MKLVENVNLRNKIGVFEDREHGGSVLGEELRARPWVDPVVLAVPLGGIPVAEKVTAAMGCELDLVPVARLPLPDEPLIGFGAVSIDGETHLNQYLVDHISLREEVIVRIAMRVQGDIIERFRPLGPRPKSKLRGRSAILVDDGLNSGYTLLAAVRYVERLNPREVVIAVPTAREMGVELLAPEVGTIFCPNLRSGYFFSVIKAYRRWADLTGAVLEPFA